MAGSSPRPARCYALRSARRPAHSCGDIRDLSRRPPVRTFPPNPADIQRVWYEVDADGAVLGRLAAEVARILRGKHKPIFAPHVDPGDQVIIGTAAKVVRTADKAGKKQSYRHSGYPGGIRSRTYKELLDRDPAETVRRAV